MGIFTILKAVVPFILYGVSSVLILRALSGRAEWLLMFVIMLSPLRNVVERLQAVPLGKDFLDILFIFLIIGTLINRMRQNIDSKSSLDPIIFVMIVYMFVSLLIGSGYLKSYYLFDPGGMREQTWKNFCMMPLLFFITLNTIKDKKWIWRTIFIMCMTMVVMDLYLLQQIRWYSSIVARDKVNGTFVYLGPNEVAGFYTQYTALLIGLCFLIKKKLVRTALLGLIVTNVFCILFLYSRGAYLGLLAGLFFLFFIKNKKLLIPLLLVLIFWKVALPEKVQDRILETENAQGELDESSQIRLFKWQNALELFKENPIMGVGYGVIEYESGDPHNIYLEILAEQGLIGIIIFLLLLFVLFIQGIKLFLGGDDDLAKGLGLGFAACIIVLMINNIFGDRWTYTEVSTYFWVFAALVVRLNILSQGSSGGAWFGKKKSGMVQELNEKYGA